MSAAPGWFATPPDSSLGCAVHSALRPGKSHTTAELKINIVRPLTDKVPLVRADGKLYAHASTTYFIFYTP